MCASCFACLALVCALAVSRGRGALSVGFNRHTAIPVCRGSLVGWSIPSNWPPPRTCPSAPLAGVARPWQAEKRPIFSLLTLLARHEPQGYPRATQGAATRRQQRPGATRRMPAGSTLPRSSSGVIFALALKPALLWPLYFRFPAFLSFLHDGGNDLSHRRVATHVRQQANQALVPAAARQTPQRGRTHFLRPGERSRAWLLAAAPNGHLDAVQQHMAYPLPAVPRPRHRCASTLLETAPVSVRSFLFCSDPPQTEGAWRAMLHTPSPHCGSILTQCALARTRQNPQNSTRSTHMLMHNVFRRRDTPRPSHAATGLVIWKNARAHNTRVHKVGRGWRKGGWC